MYTMKHDPFVTGPRLEYYYYYHYSYEVSINNGNGVQQIRSSVEGVT